jgi:hypothetical protein
MTVKTPFFLFLLFVIWFAALPVCAQADNDETEFVISGFMLDRLPGGYFYPNFIENLAPGTVGLIEESNGFALLDQPKVYFEGDSWTQFNWHYAGFSINSALDDGTPALQIPSLAIGSLALQSETPGSRDYGFRFNPRTPSRTVSRIMLSTVFPNLGGYTFLGKLAVPNHASLRAENLYSTRRRIAGNYSFDYGLEKKSQLSSLLLALNYSSLDRRFNDFNRRDSQFSESGDLLQFLTRWQRQYAKGTLDLNLAVNALGRDRLFAEEGRYPQETVEQDKKSWFAGVSWAGRPFNLKLSWLQEWQQRRPAVMDAGKDLMDIDGQGFFPFEKWGEFRATTLSLAVDKKFEFSWLGNKTEVEPYLNLSAVFNSAGEQAGSTNAIYFAGQPYLAVLWQGGRDYRNQRRYATTGTLFKMELGERISFNARMFLQYQGFSFQTSRNDCGFLQAGGEAGFTLLAGEKTRISLSYGNLPYEMRSGAADFLEDQRPGAEIYYWADGNHDGRFQEDEKGALFGLSGGSSHLLGQDLKPSRRERLLLLAATRISRHFTLNVKGLYKKIRRPLWVNFADGYGHYEQVAGQDYYLFDRPFTAFELGNAAVGRDPFYAEFLIQLQGQKTDHWYFSFSFMAHMGMGYTAFGNGPSANDIGVISESQAFPNSWINGFGRVDGDRAFVGKIFFGYCLSPRLFLSGNVKYRDGNPFAFINAFQRDGQWVITYQTIKAEDEHGKKGGPREDCIWDFNFKLSYDISLFGKKGRLELSLFNLLDFGGELSENAFSGGSRLANELQLPRSLRLGMVLEI